MRLRGWAYRSSIRSGSFTVIAALLFGAAARAQEVAPSTGPGWTQTFSPESIAPLLPPATREVTLVAAGTLEAESEAATSALGDAVARARPGLPQIAARPPGDDRRLGDDAIVAAAAELAGDGPGAQPGEHLVFIVRAFPGSAGGPPTATVALFDRRGARLVTLLAARGYPLVAPAPPADSAPIADAERARRLADLEAYSARVIGWKRPFANTVGQAEPQRGLARTHLEGDELYRILGRDDLVRGYHKRQVIRYSLALAGAPLSLGVGIAVLVGGLNQKPFYGCVSRAANGNCAAYGKDIPDYGAWVGVGAAIMVLAPAWVIAGAAINPHPIHVEEAQQLVDQYNAGLRRRYRIPDAAAPPGPPRSAAPARHDEPGTTVFLSPTLVPAGAGLALGGIFP